MKYSFVMLATTVTLFLVCEFFGLYVTNFYSVTELPYGIEPPEVSDVDAVLYLLFAIIFMTVVLLLLQKFNLAKFIKIWFGLAFLLCVSMSLSVFFGDWLAILGAFILLVLKAKESDLYVHNVSEVLVYGGVASVFVPILGLSSIVVLLLIISVYDFLSVFVTRHMIALAEGQREMGIFSGLLLKYKDESAVLGGGDIAFPLLFASVAMRDFGAIPAIFSVYGAALGLILLVVLGKRDRYYPALPSLTLGTLLGFALSLLL